MLRPKEVVQLWVDAFNKHDVEAITALYHENATNHQVANEPETDGYYNRKTNTSSADTIGNDTGRTGRGIECYPAGAIELGERC